MLSQKKCLLLLLAAGLVAPLLRAVTQADVDAFEEKVEESHRALKTARSEFSDIMEIKEEAPSVLDTAEKHEMFNRREEEAAKAMFILGKAFTQQHLELEKMKNELDRYLEERAAAVAMKTPEQRFNEDKAALAEIFKKYGDMAAGFNDPIEGEGLTDGLLLGEYIAEAKNSIGSLWFNTYQPSGVAYPFEHMAEIIKRSLDQVKEPLPRLVMAIAQVERSNPVVEVFAHNLLSGEENLKKGRAHVVTEKLFAKHKAWKEGYVSELQNLLTKVEADKEAGSQPVQPKKDLFW